MRPRIINDGNGTTDASKISYVSQINKHDLGAGSHMYSFFACTDSKAGVNFKSEDLPELQEIRRRLIGFIWPNADVFDPSKDEAAS
jgi:hypothetical protein